MNFFWNKKPTIDSIEIPDFGWLQESLTKSQKQWVNQENTMLLTVDFFELEPDISSLKDVERLHPLTQVRKKLLEIETKMEFKPEIFKLKKFEK